MMNRSDSENFASNYFKPKRVNQLLGIEPLKGLAPQGNGTPHPISSGSNIGPSLSPESLLPCPFRLESLGITPANGKVKRKKSKT
ncbi:kinesin-like protein KIF17 [Salmo salar]|uniref:Kinesin-like protein KIF17 n=1 Tax=Salmo salar TaxID=8030 RepID=A0A1S3LDT8_SALSA|nr:kinesin-like protein KIF17 [Salmo salar]